MSNVYYQREAWAKFSPWFIWVNGWPCCFKTRKEARAYEVLNNE